MRSLSDVARDVPRYNSLLVLLLSPSPLRSSLKLPASSSLLSSIADAVPSPHLRNARSNRGPRLRTQTSPPAVAVAVVAAVGVAEAAAAVPPRRCCRCRSPSCPVALPVAVAVAVAPALS
ncbi:hypothetical protein [Halobellus sp. Atlit-38R]|uniref:hypothetical protein n=1 Tax=Halobellus sp. Atlit-38R TaxID=2282131 RepID=UPI0011C3F228|nr:hypothetical protein [Halobellus sp. Atlit-38R]